MDMMVKGASFKIVKFVAPGSGVLELGWGSVDHIMKMHTSSFPLYIKQINQVH
jgi:hypothetical protein